MPTGAVPSGESEIPAPIRRNGSAIRFMGRFISELSPTSVLSNGCPARIPANIRIVLPELLHISGASGAEKLQSPLE